MIDALAMMGGVDHDTSLLHQVHPAKLGTDITAGLISTALMWQRRPAAALLIAHLPAVAASTLLMRRDLSWLRRTGRGRYVLANMPATAQAVRLLRQVVAWRAAYRHRASGVAAGAVIVAAVLGSGLHASCSPFSPLHLSNRVLRWKSRKVSRVLGVTPDEHGTPLPMNMGHLI